MANDSWSAVTSAVEVMNPVRSVLWPFDTGIMASNLFYDTYDENKNK